MNGNMDGNDEIPKPYLIIMLLLKDHIFVVIVLKWLYCSCLHLFDLLYWLYTRVSYSVLITVVSTTIHSNSNANSLLI